MVPLPLDTDGVYAGQSDTSCFLCLLAESWHSYCSLAFLPTDRVLIAGGFGRDNFRMDLQSRKKNEVSLNSLRTFDAALTWLDRKRVLVLGKGKTGGPRLSLSNWSRRIQPVVFVADYVRNSSNPRYLLLYDSGVLGCSRFSTLWRIISWKFPPNIGVDIQGSEMALVHRRWRYLSLPSG